MKTMYVQVLDKGWVSFQYTNISELVGRHVNTKVLMAHSGFPDVQKSIL